MVKLVLWTIFLLPWFSLLFLKNEAIRRYMPVALFATVINTIFYQVAWKYGWWEYKVTLFPWDKIIQVHTIYGVFLVGTIWIFYFTFRKFWLYFFTNLAIDCLYSYVFRAMWRKLGITTNSGNLSSHAALLLMTMIAMILYLYQLWQEGRMGRNNHMSKE